MCPLVFTKVGGTCFPQSQVEVTPGKGWGPLACTARWTEGLGLTLGAESTVQHQSTPACPTELGKTTGLNPQFKQEPSGHRDLDREQPV